jgi:hypothetical protein
MIGTRLAMATTEIRPDETGPEPMCAEECPSYIRGSRYASFDGAMGHCAHNEGFVYPGRGTRCYPRLLVVYGEAWARSCATCRLGLRAPTHDQDIRENGSADVAFVCGSDGYCGGCVLPASWSCCEWEAKP